MCRAWRHLAGKRILLDAARDTPGVAGTRRRITLACAEACVHILPAPSVLARQLGCLPVACLLCALHLTSRQLQDAASLLAPHGTGVH